jgi:hypothetical protein
MSEFEFHTTHVADVGPIDVIRHAAHARKGDGEAYFNCDLFKRGLLVIDGAQVTALLGSELVTATDIVMPGGEMIEWTEANVKRLLKKLSFAFNAGQAQWQAACWHLNVIGQPTAENVDEADDFSNDDDLTDTDISARSADHALEVA